MGRGRPGRPPPAPQRKESIAIPHGGKADELRSEVPAPAAQDPFAGLSFREDGILAENLRTLAGRSTRT
jgi:hypothetical protein